MTRGIRGATTADDNNEKDVLAVTKFLLEEMIVKNNVIPESVSHVFISATKDIDACFPAKAMREIQGWTHVPVMCMREMDVQNALAKCIRVMMVTSTDKKQQEIIHIFHNEAIKLRPDLIAEKGGSLQ